MFPADLVLFPADLADLRRIKRASSALICGICLPARSRFGEGTAGKKVLFTPEQTAVRT